MNLRMGQPNTSYVVLPTLGVGGRPGELKHLSNRRKSNQLWFAHHRAECRCAGYFLYCKAEEGGIAQAIPTDDNEAEQKIDKQLRQSYGE